MAESNPLNDKSQKVDDPLQVRTYLKWEAPVLELERKVAELRALNAGDNSVSIADEIGKLQQKARQALLDTYAKLTPWQKTEVARHPERPHTLDFVSALIEDFTPLAGDRYFAEDAAIMGGMGSFRGRSVVVMGHEKGADTEGRIRHNFGMAKPEGYRKAIRLMELAERFDMPVITLIDTPGAYPGIGAEERGQAEAIARSTDTCLRLGVPIISVVIGEGGSGGAVAIATANRILMLEHAIYTVASPEAAASILWRDSARAIDAATNMKITAQDLLQLKVIDGIVPEPVGGAHRDADRAIASTGDAIAKSLAEFDGMTHVQARRQRHDRFMAIGQSL
jgi:acetyl-CoA carboxylase carboxyl transferase subunit alpha